MAWIVAPQPEQFDAPAPSGADVDNRTPIPEPFRAAFADPAATPPEPAVDGLMNPDLRFCCEWWPPE
jgi:hypothetical protein